MKPTKPSSYDPLLDVLENNDAWLRPALACVSGLCLAFLSDDVVRAASGWLDLAPWSAWFFWIGVGGALLQLVPPFMLRGRHRTTKHLTLQLRECESKLDETRAKLQEGLRDMTNGMLREIGHCLGFGSQNQNTERISLYIRSADDSFLLVGRYSPNPELDRSRGRALYKSSGIIMAAWLHGKHWAKLPHPTSERYLEEHVETGLSRDEAAGLLMKSQQYFGYRVDGHNDQLGVIIVESIQATRFKKTVLERSFKDKHGPVARDHLLRMLPYMPDESVADRKGY